MSGEHLDAIVTRMSRDEHATMSARVVAEVIVRMAQDIDRLKRQVEELQIEQKRRAA